MNKNLPARVPGTGHSQKYMMKSCTFLCFSSTYFSKKSHIFEWPVSHTFRQKDDCDVDSLAYWSKKLTIPSARSGSTRTDQKNELKKNLRPRVPRHRRLAISRLQVPNPDRSVPTAAGNLFSIGAPRHRVDPEIVRSQDTNKQKQREKNRKKLTRPSARSGSTPQIPCEHHRPPPDTPLPAPVLIHLGRRPRQACHHPLASSICMRGAFVVG